jgi:nicotinamide riboside kinase
MDGLVWTSDEFALIARAQNSLEEAAGRGGGPVVICDTDAFATSLWHERYLGARSPDLEVLERPPARRLYLLTHAADVVFAQDGIRDGERIRSWMTDLFEKRLRERGMRWQWLRGGRAERLEAALAAVRALARDGWELAPPLG